LVKDVAETAASYRLDIGERLRSVRELNGMSQRELARRAGVPNSSVSMIEQGRVSPSVETLTRLLDAIPITLAHFFSDKPAADASFFYRVAPVADTEHTATESPLGQGGEPGRLEVIQHSLPPGADTGARSLADGELRSGLLVQGSLEVTLDGKVQNLSAGEGFFIGTQSLYRLRNTSAEVALVCVTRNVTVEP
jgi:transcriptional regulator with XRE-family HTH domain